MHCTARVSVRPSSVAPPQATRPASPVVPSITITATSAQCVEVKLPLQREPSQGGLSVSYAAVSSGSSVTSQDVWPTNAPVAADADFSEVNAVEDRTNTNVFIRELPTDVTDAELRELFTPFGDVLSSTIMRNIHTGVSFGRAFVLYNTYEEATAAIAAMDGYSIHGQKVVVEFAKKRSGAPVGEARQKIRKLFLRNVPLSVTVEDLRELVKPYGPVVEITTHRDTAPVRDRSKERRIAFVTFGVDGAADRAARGVHATCPFDDCNGIALMVKLAEDENTKPSRRAGRRGTKGAVATASANGAKKSAPTTETLPVVCTEKEKEAPCASSSLLSSSICAQPAVSATPAPVKKESRKAGTNVCVFRYNPYDAVHPKVYIQ